MVGTCGVGAGCCRCHRANLWWVRNRPKALVAPEIIANSTKLKSILRRPPTATERVIRLVHLMVSLYDHFRITVAPFAKG